jgi:hypothetical protein
MPQAASQSTTTHAHKHPKPDRLRARMERAVEKLLAAAERLIAELDALEPDPDLEDGHDAEPSLGQHDDREGEDVNDVGECTLGWTEEGSRIGYLGFTTYEGEAELQNEDGTDNPDDAQMFNTREQSEGVQRVRRETKAALQDRGFYIGLNGAAHFIEDGVVRVTGRGVY